MDEPVITAAPGQVQPETGPIPNLAPQADPVIAGIPERAPDDTGWSFFENLEDQAQQSGWLTAFDTLDQSAAWSAWQAMRAAPAAFEELRDNGFADLEKHREELTKDIPLHLHSAVMNSWSLAGARAQRARILDDHETMQRLAQQTGVKATTIQFAAGLVDADLPLTLLSGGSFGAAKLAAKAYSLSSKVTKTEKGRRLATDAALGVSGGAQAGLLVGAVDASVRADRGADDLILSVLQGAALGGAIQPTLGVISPKLSDADALRNSVFKLEQDVHKQMADPDSAWNQKNPPLIFKDTPDTVLPEVTTESVNAAVNPSSMPAKQQTADALGLDKVRAPASIVESSIVMQEWRKDSRFEELYAEDTSNPFVKLLVGGSDFSIKVPGTDMSIPAGQVLGKVFTLGSRDFTNFVHSKSPTANFVAAELMESPSGLVRNGTTAAIRKEMYHASAAIHSAEIIPTVKGQFVKANGLMPGTPKATSAFTREVYLQMQEVYFGRQASPEMKPLTDALDKTYAESLRQMQGRNEDTSVRGSRDIKERPGYFRYDWHPDSFRKALTQASIKDIEEAFSTGYQRASGFTKDLADKVARAVTKRFHEKSIGANNADSNLLDIDSRSAIESVLENSGLSKSEVKEAMDKLDVNTQERSKKGFLKHRNDVDLTVPIGNSDLKLVDLLNPDIERAVQNYVGDAAGSAALARAGIRDQADLSRLKDTIKYEQAALGEQAFNADYIDAVFSQFTGGVHKGYMMGVQTQGLNPWTAAMMKATRASLLQRLGLTQLMDSANIVAANGLKNAMEPVMQRLGIGGMSKQDAQKMLDDLESIGVILGQDHMVYRPHLSIDESQLASSGVGHFFQTGLNHIERATNYASGHVHVLATQQKLAAAATATNVIRSLKSGTGITDRQLRDVGLTLEDIGEIKALIKSGDIKTDGAIDLNPRVWSPELIDNFAAAMTRAVNQQVQKGMIGESSVWQSTGMGKLLSALKTFGMVANQKQLARNLMIGGHPQILTTAAYQLGFAYTVLSLSQVIQGSNMDPMDRARLAVVYAPVTGVIPMMVDPVTSMLGMDDLNVSPYGRYSSVLDTPVFETVGKLTRAPGALAGALSGNADYDDIQNAKAMFFLNWYGMNQVWSSF